MNFQLAYKNYICAINKAKTISNFTIYKLTNPDEFSSLMLSIISFYSYIKQHANENQDLAMECYTLLYNLVQEHPDLSGLNNILLVDSL